MRIILLCFLTIFLSICSKKAEKKEIKYPVIPEKKFIKILINYHLSEGIRSTSFYRDKMKYEEKVDVTDSVIKSYGYKRAVFDSTISYYCGDPEKFDNLYNKIITELSRMEAKEQEISAKKQNKPNQSVITSHNMEFLESEKILKNIDSQAPLKIENIKEETISPMMLRFPIELGKQSKFRQPLTLDTFKEEETTNIFISDVVNVYNEAQPEEIKNGKNRDGSAKENEPVYSIVDEPATFQGGDINAFRTWVQKEIVYPPKVSKAGISGKVNVQFCVNSKGAVTDAKVLRSFNSDLDKEAIRCIMSSPNWVPAKKSGKPVSQIFVIPITFKMQ